MRKIILIAALFLSAAVYGQPNFSYENIKRGDFTPKTFSGVRSMADGEHYTAVKNGAIVRYKYTTGDAVDTLLNVHKLNGVGNFTNYEFSADEKMVLIATKYMPIYRRSFVAEWWIYDRENNKAERVSNEGQEQIATFSPTNKHLAFVRENNIWLRDMQGGSVRQITIDGKFNHIINGHTDWVYEEEYGFTRAFEFSPDGTKIAYLRFDESDVREFTMTVFNQPDYHDRAGSFPYPLYTKPYIFKYPKAGESNSIVEIHVYDITTGKTRKVDIGMETDQYIPRIGWTPDGRLYISRVNRLQNHFDLLLADVNAGKDEVQSEIIYTEINKRYVERIDDQTVTFLPDAKHFIVKSECDGFMHLYLYSIDKGLKGRITKGDWDVTQFLGENDGIVYYMSAETSPLRRNLYSVKLNGKDKKRLTHDEGMYSIIPSNGFKYFISYFSNASTPNQVTLHAGDGKLVRVLEDNAILKERMATMDIPKKEFFTIENATGEKLNAYKILPHGFDPLKKYPVMMTQYNGPGSQEVSDKWSVGWLDVLAQNGYVVVCVDGRGTGYRGEEFKKCTYGDLGAKEVEDQIYAAKYLQTQSWVDSSRIGMYGWSYGGFMALNCILKGNDTFKMAIAVAPVTSWRFYDSIYTEIYNGIPQDNNQGYDNNSPVNYADLLKGKLLMIHGTSDDNVHIQNAYAMASALIEAGKQFDMMVYPNDNHSMRPHGRHHIMEKMIDYTLTNL